MITLRLKLMRFVFVSVFVWGGGLFFSSDSQCCIYPHTEKKKFQYFIVTEKLFYTT